MELSEIELSLDEFEKIRALTKGDLFVINSGGHSYLFKYLGEGSYNKAFTVRKLLNSDTKIQTNSSFLSSSSDSFPRSVRSSRISSISSGYSSSSSDSNEDTYVLKIQKSLPNFYDCPRRSVPLFNQINHQVIESGELKKAEIITLKIKVDSNTEDSPSEIIPLTLWLSPFVHFNNLKPKDQRDNILIQKRNQALFEEHGRMIVDAIVPGNLGYNIQTDSIELSKKVLPIDIGMAFKFQPEEPPKLPQAESRLKKKRSISFSSLHSLSSPEISKFVEQKFKDIDFIQSIHGPIAKELNAIKQDSDISKQLKDNPFLKIYDFLDDLGIYNKSLKEYQKDKSKLSFFEQMNPPPNLNSKYDGTHTDYKNKLLAHQENILETIENLKTFLLPEESKQIGIFLSQKEPSSHTSESLQDLEQIQLIVDELLSLLKNNLEIIENLEVGEFLKESKETDFFKNDVYLYKKSQELIDTTTALYNRHYNREDINQSKDLDDSLSEGKSFSK